MQVSTTKFVFNDLSVLEEMIEYEKNREYNKEMIFFDGPPFTTGKPHYGHLLTSTMKDIFKRWFNYKGFYIKSLFGFDVHGLPIEQLAIKNGSDIKNISKFCNDCRDIVDECENEWVKTINKIGRFEENIYKTCDIEFMKLVWNTFKKIYDMGNVYKDFKVMPYSLGCKTPLSNFESNMDYREVKDISPTIKFHLLNNEIVLVWTTTIWTLPANQALCMNGNNEYSLIEYKNEKLWILKKNIKKFFKDNYSIIETRKGKDFIGMKYYLPFNFKDFGEIICDDFVGENGTGIVHIAPAFGEDDFRVYTKYISKLNYNNSLIIHIDENGNFKEYEGDVYNNNLLELIKNDVFKKESYSHRVPFCWRSGSRLIYRVWNSWFIKVDPEKLYSLNKNVEWVPSHIKEKRFGDWLRNAKDWCVSRNRVWGTPINIWECEGEMKCFDFDDLKNIINLEDFHLDRLQNNFTFEGKLYKRVEGVFDCWFESGCVPEFYGNVPADFIIEGIDQTRGWFYSTLVISSILNNRAPYKNVIATGLVLASDGKKMAKRLNNYPDVNIILEKYGSDALRLYLINSPVVKGENLKFNENELVNITKTILIPLGNTYNFITQTLSESNSYYINKFEKVKYSNEFIDNYILLCLERFENDIERCMNEYNLSKIVNIIHTFINTYNNIYIRLNRKRFTSNKGLDILYYTFIIILKILKCFIPYTTYKMFKNVSKSCKEKIDF